MGLWAGWAVGFYGELLPNTFHAKSGGSAWWGQGLRHLGLTLAATSAWLALPAAAATWGDPDPGRTRFRRFAVGAGLLYGGYVVRVGGDFVHARLWIPLLPLLLLLAESGARRVLATNRRAGLVVLGLLLASLPPVVVLPGRSTRQGVTDQSNVYALQWRGGWRVDHASWGDGRRLAAAGAAAQPFVVATGSIGMVGYYSGLPLIDVNGLTDRRVARQDLARRGRPGHEKKASREYLVERGVHLVRRTRWTKRWVPEEWRHLTAVELGEGRHPGRWELLRHDAAVMDEVARVAPEIRFTPVGPVLDRWLRQLDVRGPERVRADLAFLDRWYFDHNEDPRRAQVEAWLAAR